MVIRVLSMLSSKLSPSLRGRGLKYISFVIKSKRVEVALFTRAWIEILIITGLIIVIPSPSLRGRGLKYLHIVLFPSCVCVALFTRAWIEIFLPLLQEMWRSVALFTRAWIEIPRVVRSRSVLIESPSLRGRGLKFILLSP